MTEVWGEEVDSIPFTLLNGSLDRLVELLRKMDEHCRNGFFSFEVKFDRGSGSMVLWGNRIEIKETENAEGSERIRDHPDATEIPVVD